MKDKEEISQEEIAKEHAKNRIVGIAIQHYLHHQRDSAPIHCSLCAAVKAFETKLGPGHFEDARRALPAARMGVMACRTEDEDDLEDVEISGDDEE